ncbi:integrase catalytic domain-containing protein [Helicobacter rodentium]|uniref:integrase catalytic domain-containing protein n=1 Tax=Helicobacter rodentium TaxID=59617 RepID=UPI00047DF1CA|nr:DDE-type integrase/transposase/recombinase [Helicobacter rodentium]
MGQWISSKEFAKSFNTNKKSLEKACFRANQRGKKICSIKSIIINFNYARGIGGNAGKILQIWNTPLSPKQVEALEKGYPVKYVLEEMGEAVECAKVDKVMDCHSPKGLRNDEVGSPRNNKATQPNVMESKDSKTLDCKGNNNEKTSQNIQGETLHTRGRNNANECASRATSSSDSTLYRNDLSNGGVVESSVCKSIDCHETLRVSRNDERVESRNDEGTKHNDATTWHNLTSSQKAQAKQREKILLDYESAKASGIRVADFLTLKNSEDSTLKLTQGKLFDWVRKYKAQGLSALSDKRGIAKSGTTSLPQWVQEEAIKMWRAMGSEYVNRMQIWRELHILAHLYVKGYSFEKFLKCEVEPLFSLNTLNRFLDTYFKTNSLEYTLITRGADKTDSYKEPAYGMQRDLYTLPNQLWQIDSSPLDAIVLDKDGKQIRPSILSIVDVYSGRSVAYLSETSDSIAVVRLMWKAFESMGKPQAIQFDNGKDYLSKQVQGLVDGLNIKSVRSAAYKGKAKAVVERRFRTIQGSYITALSSYIGRNPSERSAREQQIPKRERKSKDALGNPLKTQQKHIPTFEAAQFLLDEAVEFWNIDRVSRHWSKAQGKSPMDLWSEANFERVNVPYAQFLLYATAPVSRKMGKQRIEMKPYSFKPTTYIESKTEVLVCVNINASNEAFVFTPKGEFICKAYDENANPLTQEQLKTIGKEYKVAIKRVRELQKDAKHSSFIRMNARQEAENLKRKKDVTLLKGVGEDGKPINNAKTLKTQVREAINNAQIEQHKDNWEPNKPLDVKPTKEDNVEKWDLLQKLAQ